MTRAAVLFAGGKSTRMGRDKAEVHFRGIPFWQIQADLLRWLNFERRLLVAPEPPVWMPADFDWLPDDPAFPGAGPLGGFVGLLEAEGVDYFHVQGIDFPLLDREALSGVLPAPGLTQGWIPRVEGWLQPFVAGYPRAALELARAPLRRRENKVLPWVEACLEADLLQAVDPVLEHAGRFQNVNTPEQLKALETPAPGGSGE